MKLSFPIVLAAAFAATSIDAADVQFSDGGANVVGGTTSAQGAYPYYAIPAAGSPSLCGATLIHPDILLSAAHCEGTFANANVQIGGNLVSGADAREVIRASIERIHPNKDVDGFHPYNIGRLVLRIPVLPSGDWAGRIAEIVSSRDDWHGHFTVVEPGRIRMRRLKRSDL